MSVLTLNNTRYMEVTDFTPVITTNRTTIEGLYASVAFDLIQASTWAFEDQPMLAEFMWDFGDDGDPYNIGKGYCVNHVYRNPGIYTATVIAYYKNIEKTATVEITVNDIDETWTTYYIASNGSDTNDGLSESTPFATPTYAFSNFSGQKVRFRLRQGDTFAQSSGIIFGAQGETVYYGPLIIDSYEDQGSPSGVKPIVYDTRDAVANVSILSLLNVYDYRIKGVVFQATGGPVETRNLLATYPSGVAMSSVTPSELVTLLDCDVVGCGSISFHTEGNYNVVQDCTVRNGGSYGVFCTSGDNCAYIGLSLKEFSNDSPEYTMRLSTRIRRNYIAYCDMWGDYTKSTFQVRGDDSSWNYAYKNQFDRFAGMNQTNNEENETLHHNTFDSNIIVMRNYEGNTYGTYSQTGFFFSSNSSMARNNIVYGFDNGFWLNEHDIVGGSKKIWFYNNTVIATRASGKFLFLYHSCREVYLRNNIFYNLSVSPATSGDVFVSIGAADASKPIFYTQVNSDYNIFFGENWTSEAVKIIVGIAYSSSDPTFAQWKSNFLNGLHSYFLDALVDTNIDTNDVQTSIDSGFATVGPGSMAIDSGLRQSEATRFNFNGERRTLKTMGAI